VATGKPVYVLDLPGIAGDKHDKFERFHHDMTSNLALTRPYRGSLEAYAYTPLNEAARIADELRNAFGAG
jgi:mitochondrial fission protein ELM1